MSNFNEKWDDFAEGFKDHPISSTIGLIIALIGILAIVVITVIYQGYVVMTVWNWHVPMEDITLKVAIGINIVVGLLTYQYRDDSEDDNFKVWITLIVRYTIALATGYIVTLF